MIEYIPEEKMKNNRHQDTQHVREESSLTQELLKQQYLQNILTD